MKNSNITVGFIGGGRAAHLHANALRQIAGVKIRLKTIADINLRVAEKMAAQYGFEEYVADYNEMLKDPEIDVVHICTPPILHVPMIRNVLASGKHVVSEKPLTGYFGEEEDPLPIGTKVSRKKMLEKVLKDLEEIGKILKEHPNQKLFYAENYVYAPSVVRAMELIRKKKTKLLLMKGEVSSVRSPFVATGQWNQTGGGALACAGIHVLTTMIWMKKEEAKARGEEIHIESVLADTGVVSRSLPADQLQYITVRPQDVEDFSSCIVTFSDGTKAMVIASDTYVGENKNYIEVYGHDASFSCQICGSRFLKTCFRDEKGIEDEEKPEQSLSFLGGREIEVNDVLLRGFVGEFQNFVNCILYDQEPISGFPLAYETLVTLYAAYRSAGENQRIWMEDLKRG
ncbi:Gfo/Idh/MocA family protein [Hominifimenecus sp. rT4P-3]|uniref:Gfo/Idh/MocA family protein n=1 Tax=Hominifimenecus sp. rT4P-3 TaxID=3242979 RepID=UPI003DA23A67